MCGILGIVGKNLSKTKDKEIEKMLLSLSQRGPDDHGISRLKNCILGHTRLSIIDIRGGHQPMGDNSGKLEIVFNGEIYNYRELRDILLKNNHVFLTNSDTEVILEAYKEYGYNCLKHLDGMFAFAIWDKEKEILFMARDRFGKKPLYYSFDDENNLLFASEIKAIFETGRVRGELDLKAIDNYLALMYIPPWKTVYKNVKVIPPASYGVFNCNNIEIKKYWELSKKNISLSETEVKKEIHRLITNAVRRRMVSDVEIGSFLSGGIDSTLITSLAQTFSNTRIKTFSVGYQDYINELPFAMEASEKIGTNQHTLQVKSNMVQELHDVIKYFDEPHADSSDFPQDLISKLARSKVKVALSGDGADELFMGYGWYTRHKNLSYRAHFIEKIFLNPFSGFLKNIQIFSLSERKKLWIDRRNSNNDFVPNELKKSNLTPMEKINLFDLTVYLPGQLLTKVDRMGMKNSLEVRSPFLDYQLAEFVYNLPIKYKSDGSKHKIILKDIVREFMSEQFVHRRKQGFGAPVKKWLREKPFKNDVYKKLYQHSANIYGIIKESEVKKIIDNFYLKNDDSYNYKIWILYCLELWLIEHKKYHK